MALMFLASALLLGVIATAAVAAITPSRTAGTVAAAMTDSAPSGAVAGAAFVDIPPGGDPAAFSDTDQIAGFPASGSTFAILSSGDVKLADDPNRVGSAGVSNGGTNYAAHDPGQDQLFDLVTLRIDLDVPANANCLRVDFRFLSEEFPEFVGRDFNDGFIAELDQSTFTVRSNRTINAPNNFAFDESGRVVSVNTAGTSSDNSADTTYDGATPLLRASTPITAGAHQVYLSIFDQGDGIYDSTVFLDRLVLENAPAAECERGASRVDAPFKCMGRTATIIGSTGPDRIVGTPRRDVIAALPGIDRVDGRGGDDFICGWGGADRLNGGGGDDVIRSSAGADTLSGGNGEDRLVGNGGHDELAGGSGRDVLLAGTQNDDLWGGGGNDRLEGRAGIDDLAGGPGLDRLGGGPGPDDLRGRAHRDVLLGRGGNDKLYGANGPDLLKGDGGKDELTGGQGRDRLLGGVATDRCIGGFAIDLRRSCERT